MKINFIAFVLLLTSCISASQRNIRIFERTDKNQLYIDKIGQIGYNLDNNNYVLFKLDDGYNKNMICYLKKNDWEGKTIATVDISDGLYGDRLWFFGSSIGKQVLIWKLEDEYWSYLKVFLFDKEEIITIGDLSVGIDCKQCDSFIFPYEQIEVSEYNNVLYIKFKGEVVYRGSESQQLPYHSVNIKTDKLILKYDGLITRIEY